ncbi:MAG: hypothetical protein ACHQ52_13055 [Candidatus Eisenbacteria bacterium]
MIVGAVLRGRLLLARASFRRSRDGRRHGAWRDLVVVGLFSLVSGIALAALFERLALTHVSAADAAAVLGLALTAAFVGLSVFDLQQAVSALVLDSDLALLRAAPLGPRALAALKLLDALPSTAILTLVLVVPALAAFARAYPLPASAWLPIPIAVLALWLIPLGIGMSVALPIVRRVPPRLARETLAVFATSSLLLLWVTQAFVMPHAIERATDFASPLVGLAREWDARGGFMPPFWLSHALGVAATHAVAAPGAEATSPAASLVAWWASARLAMVALLAMALYLAVAGSQLEAVLDALAHGTARSGARRGAAVRARLEPAGGLVRALLARDARLIRRDWAVLLDVLVACLLWVLVPLATLPLDRGLAPLAGPMLVTLAVGLGYEVAGRSVPYERRSLAWVKLAPVEPARWLFAKLAGAALFSLPILLFATLAIAMALRPSGAVLAAALVVTVSALATSLSLGIWTGLRYGDPDWVNPRAMLVTRGRLLAGLGLLAQATAWVALAWVAAPPVGPTHPGRALVAPVVALAVTWLGVAMSMAELRRYEPPS